MSNILDLIGAMRFWGNTGTPHPSDEYRKITVIEKPKNQPPQKGELDAIINRGKRGVPKKIRSSSRGADGVIRQPSKLRYSVITCDVDRLRYLDGDRHGILKRYQFNGELLERTILLKEKHVF